MTCWETSIAVGSRRKASPTTAAPSAPTLPNTKWRRVIDMMKAKGVTQRRHAKASREGVARRRGTGATGKSRNPRQVRGVARTSLFQEVIDAVETLFTAPVRGGARCVGGTRV